MKKEATLASLIQTSKDGEWGKGEPFNDSVEMAVVRGTDFNDISLGNISNLPIRYIPQRIAERKTLQANDIIFETAGGSKNSPTGRSVFIKPSILHQLELPLTCASFSRFIRIDPAKANPGYVYWYLQYLYESGELKKYHKQHTGVARFQYTDFSTNEALIFPSDISIQNKIANILFAYEDLIENNTRQIKILEEMAALIYREWFVNFRFPGHEQVKMVDSPLGLIPEGWEVKLLEEVAAINASTIKKQSEIKEINYIDISSVSTGKIDKIETISFLEAPSRARRIVKHGDIIWSTVRPNRKAYSCILNPEPNLIVSTGFAVITAINVPYTYLYYAVTTENFVSYLTKNATGSAYPAVNSEDFKKVKVLIASQDILTQFNTLVEDIFQQKKLAQLENDNLRKTRDLLLPKLISGEIDLETLNTPEINLWAA